MDPKIVTRKNEEAKLQKRIVLKLRSLEWLVKETHGNMFQWGLPDLYAVHYTYRERWIEVKIPGRTPGSVFTQAQLKFFGELRAKRVGVWILTSDSDSEIAKLHQEDNWWKVLRSGT
jgi:hypothetical protein